MTSSITPVANTPLTQADITRLPMNATPSASMTQTPPKDAFVPSEKKKMSGLTKTIIFLAAVAAATVGLKRFCPDLMKIDVNNSKWTDCIKSGIVKIADWVEYPFIKLKDLCSGAGKAVEKGAEAGAQAAS